MCKFIHKYRKNGVFTKQNNVGINDNHSLFFSLPFYHFTRTAIQISRSFKWHMMVKEVFTVCLVWTANCLLSAVSSVCVCMNFEGSISVSDSWAKIAGVKFRLTHCLWCQESLFEHDGSEILKDIWVFLIVNWLIQIRSFIIGPKCVGSLIFPIWWCSIG